MIEERILQQKELLKKLTLYENNKNKEEQIVDYKIGFKELPEVTVATMRYKGKYSDMGIYIKEIYKEVKGKADGAPFAIY